MIDAGGATPVVITGSMNWTNAGDTSNDENTLILHDPTLATGYQAAYDQLDAALSSDTQCAIPPGDQLLFLPFVVGGNEAPLPVPDVQLKQILYNPTGDDAAGEYVSIENVGGAAQDMTGWQLQDAASNSYTFPTFSLEAGSTVQVFVGNGTDSMTALYWGRNSAVWNNGGDTATLLNGAAETIDSCEYEGGGEIADC